MPKKKKSKKFDYFDAFEQQAKMVVKEAKLLNEVVNNFTTAADIEPYLPKAHEIEKDADAVCHSVFDAILPDFVTPLDREDIISLTLAMDEIVDIMEELIQLFYMYDVHFMHNDAKPFVKIIVKCAEALETAVKDFRNAKKSKDFRKLVIYVNDLEDEADEMYMAMIRKLYTKDKDNAVRIAVWDRIFTSMEECVDQMEGTADLMNSYLVKYA